MDMIQKSSESKFITSGSSICYVLANAGVWSIKY